MTDIRQQIAMQLEGYPLEALKAAVQEWVSASDGSFDAFEKSLEAHRNDGYDLTSDDWAQLQEQGLVFDSDAATREEHMRRLQRYRETGHAIPHEEVMAWLESIGTDSELPCPK
jgi:hypothetical protein